MRLDLGNDVHQRRRLLVAALGFLVEFFASPLHSVEVGYDQLGRDCLNVTDWVDASLDMVNVAVLKTAHHVHNRIDLTDVTQELIAQPFPRRGALDQPGDIDELHRCGDDLLRTRDRCQFIQSLVGNADDTDIGVDGAKRIIRRLRFSRAGNGVKQGGLADIGQADDSGSQHVLFDRLCGNDLLHFVF